MYFYTIRHYWQPSIPSRLNNIVKTIVFAILASYPLSGFPTTSHLPSQKTKPVFSKKINSYAPQSNWKVFDEINNTTHTNDLRNIDYSSSIEQNGSELITRFDAKNHSSLNDNDNYKLEINRFFINYKNRNNGIQTRIGRQASSGVGVVGAMDGIMLQTPLISNISVGASAGFPVYSLEKDKIQSNKPFFVFNATLPGIFKSLTLKPYIATQQLDGFLNRKSIGSEIHFHKNKASIYQMVDYNMQFNSLNKWLIQGRLQKSENTTHYLSFKYRRNPDLALHNALINEYRASDLTGLNKFLTKEEIIAQANDRTAKNFSTSIGSSFPLNARLQVNTDLKRHDQIYKTASDSEIDETVVHNYQNEVSTQLVASKLHKKSDSLSVEYEYVDARYYTNTSISIQDQIQLSGLHQLELEFRLSKEESDNGELLLTTLPTATFTCQCSKNLYSELEIGYANWNYSSNTQQLDDSRVYANVNFRLDL